MRIRSGLCVKKGRTPHYPKGINAMLEGVKIILLVKEAESILVKKCCQWGGNMSIFRTACPERKKKNNSKNYWSEQN